MEQLDLNVILKREHIVKKIENFLNNIKQNGYDDTIKRGLYIYGNPGSGKTTFIVNLLKRLNYDIIKYDAGDIRNKSIIETITNYNISDRNVISMFTNNVKRLVIIMDEIDGMNNGDKGGINSLIKLIRPKKTKKQKMEDKTFNPIICISNYHIDKKIKELMKVCEVIELKSPTNKQMGYIIESLMPCLGKTLKDNIMRFIEGDLRKLESICNIYKNHQSLLKNKIIHNIFKKKSCNEDTKIITKNLINNRYTINMHNMVINETDRTIIGLLWHENIIDVLEKIDKPEIITLYCQILNNICFSDYIDRITFQKQIWQFNEMSSLIKTFKNNKLIHDNLEDINHNPLELRFTKVLTKYSTEYNNSLFIQNLCQKLILDKKDMFSLFLKLQNEVPRDKIYSLFDTYDITNLDIDRIYRYLDKYIGKLKEYTEDV
jgi:DNA polymerase III delta prime subunit